MTTNQKGSVAEVAIAAEAMKLGIGVWLPLSDHERYDLILAVGDRLVRTQCKYATRRGDVVVVPFRTARRAAEGIRRTLYTEAEIDAFAAYCPDIERCYFLPISDLAGMPSIALRLTAARNNQRARINWAKDYELAAKLIVSGPIAQLGERRAGSA